MAVGVFEGYLIKPTAVTDNAAIAFSRFIDYASWDTSPNQREEIKAYRDDNTRDLTRVTAAGRKSTISFKLRKGLHLADKMTALSFFTANESNTDERKINLKYWNDDINDYKTGDFYRANMTFPIDRITHNDIIYGEISIELVEY